MELREYNFDGLVGPTHNYGGLSQGNLASTRHGGDISNPKAAALQGLSKMKFVSELGVGQAVLPPQMRPSLRTLRALGFTGSDEEVLARVAQEDEQLLRLCSSAAAMWTANAATCAPSTDTDDRRMHLTPANLQAMFHRAIEAETTERVLRAIFADERSFVVHPPLPGGGQFADEGAANHTRLAAADGGAVHIFAWGRKVYGKAEAPKSFPARQTLEASRAVARRHRLAPARCLFPQQAPAGIDAGAFHTDVLGVGHGAFLMFHELAFMDHGSLLRDLAQRVGPSFRSVMATEKELPAARAVKSYAFNSQLLPLPDGPLAIVAPKDAEEDAASKAFLDRVVASENPVRAVHYLDLRQSMNNGGGPACLRQRIWLTPEEQAAVKANVFFTPGLHRELESWVNRYYRDRLSAKDLADPKLARETMEALDALSQLLRLGSVFEFQQ